MFELLKARMGHGYQAIAKPLEANVHPAFPGVPAILRPNPKDFQDATRFCPRGAIGEFYLDLGACNFCGECQRRYPETFRFEPDFRLASSSREGLNIRWQEKLQRSSIPKVEMNPSLAKHFRRSLAIRNVSAAGCNACELELGACSNVNFDMGRYGVEIVASPRHADALILTGPVSSNMTTALQDTWMAIPEPKALILCGCCAISGGIFSGSDALNRSWLDTINPCLFVPGCPAHPLSIIHGLMSLLGRVR